MKKFELEFILRSSSKVVFDRLSTASGLSEWFADDVSQKGNIYTFSWNGTQQQAEMVQEKKNYLTRFRWLDSDDDESYFEFRLEVDDITNDLALFITDFAEENEVEEAIELWTSQVADLKHALGVYSTST